MTEARPFQQDVNRTTKINKYQMNYYPKIEKIVTLEKWAKYCWCCRGNCVVNRRNFHLETHEILNKFVINYHRFFYACASKLFRGRKTLINLHSHTIFSEWIVYTILYLLLRHDGNLHPKFGSRLLASQSLYKKFVVEFCKISHSWRSFSRATYSGISLEWEKFFNLEMLKRKVFRRL